MKDTDLEFSNGQTVQNTKDTGASTRQKAREPSGTLKVTFMMANSVMTKPMATVFTLMLMEASIKEVGGTTCKTAMEMKFGLTAQNTMEITKKERSTASELMTGLMAQDMKETGLKIGLRVLAFIPGLTEEDTKAIGKTTICTAKGFILGKTAENMTAATRWTRSTVLEYTTGRTTGSTRACGRTESRAGRASTRQQTEE